MSAKDATKSLADPALLEIIDKLVELNIGDSVDLPQVDCPLHLFLQKKRKAES